MSYFWLSVAGFTWLCFAIYSIRALRRRHGDHLRRLNRRSPLRYALWLITYYALAVVAAPGVAWCMMLNKTDRLVFPHWAEALLRLFFFAVALLFVFVVVLPLLWLLKRRLLKRSIQWVRVSGENPTYRTPPSDRKMRSWDWVLEEITKPEGIIYELSFGKVKFDKPLAQLPPCWTLPQTAEEAA